MPGLLYNAKNVVVGLAMGWYAPVDTPLPADHSSLFDPMVWNPTKIVVTGAAGGFTVTVGGVTSGTIAYNATAAAAQVILDTAFGVSNVDITSTVAGTYFLTTDNQLQGKAITATAVPTATIVTTQPLWVPFGSTDQGWKVNATKQVQEITIEEQSTSVARGITQQQMSFEAALAEPVVRNLQIAFNTTKAVQAAATGVVGKTTLAFTDTITQYAVGLETQTELGFPKIYYSPEMVALQSIDQEFRRAAAKHMLPLSFGSVCASALNQIINVDAAALP